ncbi:MAG: DNA mismatch repair endonuclease MutL [Bacteriovorax sp.]|nr:DNA mismatch repair endonuclease MutL [Bacteriovorax sp.]
MNKEKSTPQIEILPEHIIDQIKAGEVLERPASLIKELVENSLDAGSTEINIHLVENGLDLLSIEDNGHGMSFESLPYAFLRHATSKLKNYEDLYHLYSFGFRGEALASVAASARLTCTTQPKNLEETGGKIIIHGGSQELLIPYRSSSHGTSLYIKDLFYNTPARLKFIKSKISEKSALKKMLYAFVLSNSQTSFSIKWDEKEREIFKVVAPEHTQKRVEQVFYSKNSKNSESEIWNASEFYQDYKVEVYFTPGTHTSPQYRHHYLFANNRFFQDKSLHLSVLRTLEPLWRLGESGHYMVKITVPTEELDVNVHPNKTQIKFLKSDVIYSLLVTSLRGALKAHAKEASGSSASSTEPLKQEQFFSREENQSFDLLNMNSAHQSFDYRPSGLGLMSSQTQPSNQSSSPVLGFISASIVLITLENKFYIADIKKIISEYVSTSLLDFVKNDELSGPLLISEPFKVPRGKIDSHFEDLKDLGFDLDRLNSEVIALRTLPRFAPQNLSRDITFCLIQYFEQNKVSQFDSLEFKSFLEANWPTTNLLAPHTLTNILENNNVKNSVLVLLDDKNLKRLL